MTKKKDKNAYTWPPTRDNVFVEFIPDEASNEATNC